MSGLQTLCDIRSQVFTLRQNYVTTCRLLKKAGIQRSCPHFSYLPHTCMFGGNIVYGRANGHDFVCFHYAGKQNISLVDFVFAPTEPNVLKHFWFFLIRMLRQVQADPNFESVVYTYSHSCFGYSLSAESIVQKVFICCEDLLHPVMLVIDAYRMKKCSGINKRFDSIPDNPESESYPLV